MMETTLHLDDRAYEAASKLAQRQARPIGEVVSELILRAVFSEAGNGAKHTINEMEAEFVDYEGSERFPVFKVPADAPTLTSEMVKEMMNDFP